MSDEAQTLPEAVVSWDPPRVPPAAAKYAALLLERITNVVEGYPTTTEYTKLLLAHTERAGDAMSRDPSRTTREADQPVMAALHDFAQAVLAGAKRDLDRKVGLDLAVTLVPLLADKKEI